VPESYQYALLRAVPSIARGERVNVGLVVFCRRAGFLELRFDVDDARLTALDASIDAEAVRSHLAGLRRVASGEPGAGAVAALPQSERFHWLVAPSSTVVQPGPVHIGLVTGADPAALLERLFAELVGAR
jgi:hypothetical protein